MSSSTFGTQSSLSLPSSAFFFFFSSIFLSSFFLFLLHFRPSRLLSSSASAPACSERERKVFFFFFLFLSPPPSLPPSVPPSSLSSFDSSPTEKPFLSSSSSASPSFFFRAKRRRREAFPSVSSPSLFLSLWGTQDIRLRKKEEEEKGRSVLSSRWNLGNEERTLLNSRNSHPANHFPLQQREREGRLLFFLRFSLSFSERRSFLSLSFILSAFVSPSFSPAFSLLTVEEAVVVYVLFSTVQER